MATWGNVSTRIIVDTYSILNVLYILYPHSVLSVLIAGLHAAYNRSGSFSNSTICQEGSNYFCEVISPCLRADLKKSVFYAALQNLNQIAWPAREPENAILINAAQNCLHIQNSHCSQCTILQGSGAEKAFLVFQTSTYRALSIRTFSLTVKCVLGTGRFTEISDTRSF